MKVSFIIPTKNRAKILEETVLNIFNTQNYPHDNFEVLVVNDGEEFLSPALTEGKNLRIIQNSGSGAASARNSGANIARGELLIFIDDDMLIEPECINRHLYIHNTYERSIVSGSWKYNADIVHLLDSTPFGRYKLLHDYKSLEGKVQNMIAHDIFLTDSLASFNLSVLKIHFEELHGFNQSFPYAGCEDQEFTIRAKQLNFKLLMDSTNISIHNEKDRADMEKWLKRQYTGVQGYVILCELFPYRKTETLYTENGVIQKNDSLKIKAKKILKRILSTQPAMLLIHTFVKLMETIHIGDGLLFKFYRTLTGLYIYKGFLFSQKTNLSSKV